MISHLLCASMVLGAQEAPKMEKKIETPIQEVVIQARKIVIPHIPTSVSQAHKEYKQVGAQIQEVILDLEKELIELYAATRSEMPLPPTLRVRKQEVEAVRFFNQMIEDKTFEQLNKKVIESWTTWQKTLVASGLATHDEKLQMKHEKANHKDSETIKKISLIKKSDRFMEQDRKQAFEFATRPDGRFDEDFYNSLVARVQQYDTLVFTTQKHVVLSNSKAPELSIEWLPLASHLQTCANQFVNLDTPEIPYQSEGIQKLKTMAKIHFLERCRFTLWLCQTIWSRMTSREEPSPLKGL